MVLAEVCLEARQIEVQLLEETVKPKERRMFHGRSKTYVQAVKHDAEGGLTVNQVAIKGCINLGVLDILIDTSLVFWTSGVNQDLQYSY